MSDPSSSSDFGSNSRQSEAPLFSDEQIEEALAARAEPLLMEVAEAADVAMLMRDQYEAALAELRRQLDEAQNPADVTVTIGTEACGQSHFETGMQDIDDDFRWGDAEGRRKVGEVCAVLATHVMNFGAPNLWPDPAEPVPTNWNNLDARMNLFVDLGAEPMLVFYNYAVWQKCVINKDGSETPCDPADPFTTDGRVVPAYYDQFRTYCTDIALRYLAFPYSVRTAVFGNELKGYVYCRDGSKGSDIADYTELYNIWVAVMEEAAVTLEIDPADLKLGGPYAPVRCEGSASNDTFEEGHPYGYYRKDPFEAMGYWLEHAVRGDFIAWDMGSGNAEGEELVETFTVQATKYADVAELVRRYTDLPMVICECYPKCADDENADAQRVAAAKTVAHLSMVYAGYWMAWQWGPTGQGEYSNQNGGMLRDYDSGETNPWYDCYKLLRDHFGAGATLYPVTVQGEGVYAAASDRGVMLVNMTAETLQVRVGENVYELAAYEVLEAGNPLGAPT